MGAYRIYYMVSSSCKKDWEMREIYGKITVRNLLIAFLQLQVVFICPGPGCVDASVIIERLPSHTVSHGVTNTN
jgi:hypothetical protein